MHVILDTLEGPEVKSLLRRHPDEMSSCSPPESVHALDLDGLRAPEITFWSIWDGSTLLGCGALKELDARHGEIKSMHVHSDARGRGVAEFILKHILKIAQGRAYTRLSLETGSMAAFIPARKLYEKFRFKECPPFGGYRIDMHSIFMTKEIG